MRTSKEVHTESNNATELEEHYTSIPLTEMMPDFKRLVKNVANDMHSNDLSNLTYMCDEHQTSCKGERLPALDVLRKQQQKGRFAHDNIEPLENLLEDIDRCDLVKKHVEPYKRKYGEHAVNRASDKFPNNLSRISSAHSLSTQAMPRPTSYPTQQIYASKPEKLKPRALTDPVEIPSASNQFRFFQKVGAGTVTHNIQIALRQKGKYNKPHSTSRPSNTLLMDENMQQRLHQMCLGPASSSMTASTPVSEQWNDIPDPDNLERSGFEANFHYSEIEQAGDLSSHHPCSSRYSCGREAHSPLFLLGTQDPTSSRLHKVDYPVNYCSHQAQESLSLTIIPHPLSTFQHGGRCQSSGSLKNVSHQFESGPTPRASREIILDQKKLCYMIIEHNYSEYNGETFKLLLPWSDKCKGPTISMKVFPLCCTHNKHLSVHIKVEVPKKFDSYVSSIYHRNLQVKIVPCHHQGDPLAKTSQIEIPLILGQDKFEHTLKEVVPHDQLIYTESSIIRLNVTASLSLYEEFGIVESERGDTVLLSLITPSVNGSQD